MSVVTTINLLLNSSIQKHEIFSGPLFQDHYLIMDEKYNVMDLANWNSKN
ncbi:MAG: hypothetical protein ACRAS9_02605 [Mycoplasma sp.]